MFSKYPTLLYDHLSVNRLSRQVSYYVLLMLEAWGDVAE